VNEDLTGGATQLQTWKCNELIHGLRRCRLRLLLNMFTDAVGNGLRFLSTLLFSLTRFFTHLWIWQYGLLAFG